MSRRAGRSIGTSRKAGTLRAAVALVVIGIGFAFGVSAGKPETRRATDWPPYIVYRPAGLSRATPVPLVIGIGGTATRDGSGLNGFADRYGFVATYPDPFPINVPPNEDASQTARLQYISDIIDQLKVSQNIDPSRVYVTGASKSGIESYRVACRLATKVTAIGSVAGALLTKEAAACNPARPISVMEFHGTADTAVPINGNQFYTPAATTMDFFRKLDGCPAQPSLVTRGPVQIQTWSPCQAGTSVRLVTYVGGDHGWPRNNQVDATAELWSFFSSHVTRASAPVSQSMLKRLTVVRTSAGWTLAIRLAVDQDSTVRASVLRGSRRFAAKTFGVKAGIANLKLRLSKTLRPGTYKLNLVLHRADGSSGTIVKSFRVAR